MNISCARGPPQFLKNRSENAGANENLSWGFPPIPGIAPRVAPRIVVSVLLKSCDAIPRMEFRELLREYPGTLREHRELPFHSQCVFSLKAGWSPAECTKIARFSAVAAAIFTAPGKIARLFEAPRCTISSAKKIASEPRFSLR